jgi:hypothetical protein
MVTVCMRVLRVLRVQRVYDGVSRQVMPGNDAEAALVVWFRR